MMTIKAPTERDVPALKSLWREAFGDSDAFIDAFMERVFSPERAMCAVSDGEIAAALYWFECECDKAQLAYLYAIATRAEHRGRGICRELMEHTRGHLTKNGFSGILLVPASERLAAYYAKLGYTPLTSVRELEVSASEEAVPLREITAKEYAALRRELLPSGGVIEEGASLELLSLSERLFASDGLILAAHRESDTLEVCELLGDISVAPMIVRSLGCKRGRFRTVGDGRPFAMFRALNEAVTPPNYFGLAFD